MADASNGIDITGPHHAEEARVVPYSRSPTTKRYLEPWH